MKRNIALTLLAVMLAVIPFFVMFSHSVSTSQQLTHAKQEIATLTQALAAEKLQRCEQAYEWESNRDYPATITSMDMPRTYRVHTPSGYTADKRYPVIIAFDGLDGTSGRAEHESGLSTTPALTVYPDALIGTTGATAWQGAPYSPVGINDVQFIDDMLVQITNDFCIDTKAVYMVGMSNGAGFAFLAACELQGKIAGVAGISGAYYQACPHAGMPARTLYIHSLEDSLVPYMGSPLRQLPPIYRLAQAQGQAAQCRQMIKARSSIVERFSWRQCHNDRRVTLLITQRQPHGWLHVANTSLVPEGSLSERTTSAVIWDFFTEE